MKIIYAALAGLAIIILLSCRFAATRTATDNLRWSRDDQHIALLRNDTVLWQLNFNPAEDKPYFHPLRTPSGQDIALKRPSDHPWHRGLWFSWKSINGVNYWEEDPKAGFSEGRSLIKNVSSKLYKDFSARITIDITYQDKNGPTIEERRVLHISSPLRSEGYAITWDQSFTALKTVELDLEKPAKHGGVKWGGYAGLSLRGATTLRKPLFRASNGWSNSEDTTGYGEKATWMDVTASIADEPAHLAGITIFDHPGNPRYPSPWYIWYAADQHLFFTPSILFDGPLLLHKEEKLHLKYQTYIHDGQPPVEQIEQMSQAFASH